MNMQKPMLWRRGLASSRWFGGIDEAVRSSDGDSAAGLASERLIAGWAQWGFRDMDLLLGIGLG